MIRAWFRRGLRIARNRARFYRPLVEGLETRDLLAFNLFITPNPTANVASNTVNGTTIFLATGSGANVNVDDINAELNAGNNVVIDSGVAGLQAGTIATNGFTSQLFNNAVGTTLTLRSGSGIGSGDINITGLRLRTSGSIILDANDEVILEGTISADTLSITAGSTITMPNEGQLVGRSLSMTAGGDIGTVNEKLLTNVSQLTTDTSADNGRQEILEANGLSALNLNAGTGTIQLQLTAGALADSDPAVDITAGPLFSRLFDATPQNVGSATNPIGTSVDFLEFATHDGGGSQFIQESNGLTGLNLVAAPGDVTLIVAAGAVVDTGNSSDILANNCTVTLSDPTAQDFGSAANPIGTTVRTLTVNTSAGGGDQFITEGNTLTGLNLDAGTGDVTLVVTTGDVSDTDGTTDITADVVTVTLFDETPKNFGSTTNSIRTSVNSLSVSTDFGSGSQFIREVNGLTGLNLVTSLGGDVELSVVSGDVLDADAAVDIVADTATVELANISLLQNFGAAANPIQTNVNGLDVEVNDDGNQFITESNGLTSVRLVAPSATPTDITLTLLAGGITDTDPDIDINPGDAATIVLNSVTAQSVGSASNPVETAVDSLTINTSAGGGNQFVSEVNKLDALALNAGAGNVTLEMQLGSVFDTDSSADIIANTASITINAVGTSGGHFGAAANPIGTNVTALSVNTSAVNSNQFIAETNSTTVISLDAGTGNVTLVGGTFNLRNDTNAIGDLSTVTVNSPAVLNLANFGEEIGGLAGSGNVVFPANAIPQTLTVGGNGQNTTFSGDLIGNDPQVAELLRKIGTGTLTFSGDHTFAEGYFIDEGTLLVTGSLAAGPGILALGGVLGGTGVINRDVSLSDEGHLAPGTSTGSLDTGDLRFIGRSFFDVEITSDTAGQFDQVIVTGTVEIASSATLNIAKVGNVNLQNGDILTIIDNDGTADDVTGTFKNLPEGTNLGSNFLGSGLTANIKYKGTSGTNNDVVIVMSPGSLFPWHNSTILINDVAGNGSPQPDTQVAANDVVTIINFINANGSGPIPENAVLGLPFGFLDTKADNQVVAEDVLQIINYINSGRPLGGEAEATPSLAEALAWEGEAPAAPSSPTPSLPPDLLLLLLATDLASQPTTRRRA